MQNLQTSDLLADLGPVGILFDCDGVLVDSEPALAEIAATALRDFGAAAIPADFKPYIGMSEDMYLGEVTAKYGVEFNETITHHVYEKYVELAANFVHPFPGMRDMLIRLKTAGCRIAVASSAEQIKVTTNLKLLDLPAAFFDVVITGSDIERKKPFPDIYLLAASRCGVSPDRCFVVEDAVSGIQAGKAAGMTCIGFTSSHTAEELREAGADIIVDDIRDVWTSIQPC
ncbi:MAG: HAD family phosphatase [Eubacteriales bacterium]